MVTQVGASIWVVGGIEVCSESLREDMNRGEDVITISFANIAVLDKQVLRVLRKARGCEDTEGRCTVILKGSRILLWISEPGQIAAVDFDMFGSYGEGIVFGVGRIKGDLCRLYLGNYMEGSTVRSDTKRD